MDLDIGHIPFARTLGVEILEATQEKIVGTVIVRSDLCTVGHSIHGGAVMAFADTLGAIGARLNLPEAAAGTTTIESKTNFLRGAREGSTLKGTATPLHVGRRMSVWQTRLTDEDGAAVAVVTQTQLVL